MQTETTQQLIASDVPEWLVAYGNKLNWTNPQVAGIARAQVKKYMLSLPQKNYAWQRGICSEYNQGAIPADVLADISSVNWTAVPQIVQQGMKVLLPPV